jgi:hypothetical protein
MGGNGREEREGAAMSEWEGEHGGSKQKITNPN